MITIVEPKKHIADLWGQQRVKQEATFRQMRYVLRVDHEGKVLLHNVVTGQLVVLSPEEVEAIQALPSPYVPVMEELIKAHYLVPEDYDEHQQVVNLRLILRKLGMSRHSSNITGYMILPTTACNARCYYCYQRGVRIATMSKQTADQVIQFICQHCGEQKEVFITWFGGEPTVASNRIDQICEGLCKNGVQYGSFMISNGYLFDTEMIERAKILWKLQRVQITVDGTEKTYNRTKAYVNVHDNPYQRVMQNIGMLLEHKIAVGLRMNYDLGNWLEFAELVKEVKERFHGNELLRVVSHQILGENPTEDGKVLHGTPAWFSEKKVELDAIVRNAGLQGMPFELPYTRFEPCQAASDMAVIITPDGQLVSCPEQIGFDQVKGDVWNGLTNFDLISKWKQFVDYPKCIYCCFKPYCVHMLCCSAQDKCTSQKSYLVQCITRIRHIYNVWTQQN